ncbi:MAG TPA: hypothetical protein VNZ45_07445 [Bacteroidia bacterium]|jgi:hypothetical protein|nr:hypothetical protein [Bacteroidia bacterium]
MLTLALTGLVLLIINTGLVYFIRTSRTFAVYPGLIFLVLFLCFGGYTVYSITLLAPDVSAAAPGPKGKGVLAPMLSQGKTITYQEEKKRRKEDSLETIAVFLNVMIIQAFLAAIAAIVGSKLVTTRRSYYYAFTFLYIFLFILMSSISYLIQVRIG